MQGTLEQLKLQQDRLWSDHFWKTRIVIKEAAASSKCLTAELASLQQNQDELGANFAALVSNPQAAVPLAKALHEHISLAVEIVTAAIKKQPIDALNKKWEQNGTDIARIYNLYYPLIDFATMNELFQGHLKSTLNEAVAVLSGNCDDSVAKGDEALRHVTMMANYLGSAF
jgi:hypothetical protein